MYEGCFSGVHDSENVVLSQTEADFEDYFVLETKVFEQSSENATRFAASRKS